MAINSKQKGARFERELARRLKEYGYDNVRRTVQYCGKTGEAADLVGLPGVHIEAKAVERLNIYDAIAQAKQDAHGIDLPAVFHKKNYHEILVTMELDDFMQIYRHFEVDLYFKGRELKGGENGTKTHVCEDGN